MRVAFPVALLLAACSSGGGATAETDFGRITAAAASGRIESDSKQYRSEEYRFEAAIDGQLVIRLDLPAGADYDLALFDAAHRRLATSRSDNRTVPIERMYAHVTADRVYFVEVSRFAGVAGDYHLTVGIEQPAESVATAIGSLAQARSFHAMVALPDGRALIAGGTSDPSSQTAAILSALDSTELFDPAIGAFLAGPDLGAPRFGLTATLLPTGRVLLAGGDLLGTADLFDPDGPDQLRIPMTGGLRVLCTATLLADGRVLLAGGTTIVFNPAPSARSLATTTIFDPKTRSFSAGPMLQAARASHAAVRTCDGRVLLTGGVGRADSEWVDATTSTPGPAMAGVRDDHTATLLADGRVLLAGGQDGSGLSVRTAEVLDAGSFRTLAATMTGDRADHRAIAEADGSVLLLGGEHDPASGPDVILTSVERFDPASESFAPAQALLVPRDDHRIARLIDGRLLVTGGENAASESIADAEIYPR